MLSPISLIMLQLGLWFWGGDEGQFGKVRSMNEIVAYHLHGCKGVPHHTLERTNTLSCHTFDYKQHNQTSFCTGESTLAERSTYGKTCKE